MFIQLLPRLEDVDPQVRKAALKVLNKVGQRCAVCFGYDEVRWAVVAHVEDSDASVRKIAVAFLPRVAFQKGATTAKSFLGKLHHDDAAVRLQVFKIIARNAERGDRVGDPCASVRKEVAKILLDITLSPCLEVTLALKALRRDHDASFREEAAAALDDISALGGDGR